MACAMLSWRADHNLESKEETHIDTEFSHLLSFVKMPETALF